MNETEILKLLATQGGYALLFCYLLFYVLKENSKREAKYQEIIAKLTEKFECIENGLNGIKEVVKEVKDKIFK